MFNFENLRVYKEGLEFTSLIYNLTKKFPKDELFGLTSQLRRAAVSICLNIAEGSSRTKIDFKHFLSLARGSCNECITILTIAQKQNYINESDLNQAYEQCLIIAKMISKLRNSI